MNTYLLTWNPNIAGTVGLEWLEGVVEALGHRKLKKDQWSSGNNRSIEIEDRVFLLRQGNDCPGIIGSGYIIEGWSIGDHWDEQKKARGHKANYIRVKWDTMVLPQSVLPRSKLLRGILPESLVNAQSSGRNVDTLIANRLKTRWFDHLKSIGSDFFNTPSPVGAAQVIDDSFDDLPGVDNSSFGSDGAPSVKKTFSGVKRDPRVRREVIKRSNRVCERSGCGAQRNYLGFIDVHHILGAVKSDRVWNCVALCPNCHREAHYAPDRKKINKQLLRFAAQFK